MASAKKWDLVLRNVRVVQPQGHAVHEADVAEGLDAGPAIVDPAETWTIRAKDSESTQGYAPFESIELSARVKATFLRGRYLHRPTR